jgi:pimeloyl-ACP methyl ester carboxylesterase
VADTDYYQHRSIWGYLNDLEFAQGYVDAGVRTRYVRAGPKDAPALIMLHGGGGSWENCFGNLRAHAAHFNTYAFDMVGHGFSAKPNKTLAVADYVEHLRTFMDVMGIERASFIGVSLGSWVSTKFTTLYPERVDKVTMISAWGRPQPQADPDAESIARAKVARLASVENPTWEAMEGIFAGLITDPKNRLPDLLELRQAIYRQPEMKQSMRNIFAGLAPDVFNRNALTDAEVAKITRPYLIIASVDHQDVFLESSLAYAKLIPNARLVEMTGTFHWAQWERVDDFNRINLEFLRGG